MSTLYTTDGQLELFVPSDEYHFTVDNRPLRKMLQNSQTINEQLEDVVASDFEVATFVVETPAADTTVGGIYVAQEDGVLTKVVVSQGTGGSSGDHTVDVNINGTSALSSFQIDLPWDDADGVVVSTTFDVTAISAGDRISIDLDAIQSGSPKWVRVDVYILKAQGGYSASDFD